MKSEIVEAFSQIVKEKNIDKELLSEIVENIFLTMIKKKFGTTDNFSIFVKMDKGEIEIYQSKTIVEQVVNPELEIDLETAKSMEPDLELGDEFLNIVDPASFGRRLIISAKQNLNQKLKDIEKDLVYDEFQNRVGEIIIGDIRQINRDEIFLNVDKTEVVMPKCELIPTERYRRGETLRTVIKAVERTSRGPVIIVSRADPKFLIRLFEMEVPEIDDGIIEIKAIAREPGDRTKIAVYSNDTRIDAVGACVGMKGMRIQSIVKELNNEKIDIINWSTEPEIFITRALSPAKPSRIVIDEEAKKVIAVLDETQISLAIGKGGQNRRLASKLTGYDIQTMRDSEYKKLFGLDRGRDLPLSEAKTLSPAYIEKLRIIGGYRTIRDVLDAGTEGLMELPGIGLKTAEKILKMLGAEENK